MTRMATRFRALGNMPTTSSTALSDIRKGLTRKVMMVKDTSTAFLQYLGQLAINVGTCVAVIDKISFDSSFFIEVNGINQTVS